MDVMDIAAMSIDLSASRTMSQVGVAVEKMAMDDSKANASSMINMIEDNTKAMEMSVQPYLGGNFDAKI